MSDTLSHQFLEFRIADEIIAVCIKFSEDFNDVLITHGISTEHGSWSEPIIVMWLYYNDILSCMIDAPEKSTTDGEFMGINVTIMINIDNSKYLPVHQYLAQYVYNDSK